MYLVDRILVILSWTMYFVDCVIFNVSFWLNPADMVLVCILWTVPCWVYPVSCFLGTMLYWFIKLSVSCILYPSDCPLCRWEPCRAAGEPWDSLGSPCTWVVDDMGHGLGGSQEDTGLHKVYIRMIQDYTRYTSRWYRTTQGIHQHDTGLHKVYIRMIQNYTRYTSWWYRTTQGIYQDDTGLHKVYIRMIEN